ncbi:4169_t:CDS:2 [Acaulospora colombiana]|uniref:4169_t:CDS:1 n=1 Tax=Acaulospora colombiana TaxID=27376 RepID=A0ACA9K0E2_9GLOM|nr:4169_t:CDS:2 [Acaulospora colombiana]
MSLTLHRSKNNIGKLLVSHVPKFWRILRMSAGICSNRWITGNPKGHLFTLAISTNISIVTSLILITACHNRTHRNMSHLVRQQLHRLPPAAPDWIVLKSFTLAFTAMIISCLSVLNFSLAVFVSSMVVIPFSLFQPMSNGFSFVNSSGTSESSPSDDSESTIKTESFENGDSPRSGSSTEAPSKKDSVSENVSLTQIGRLLSRDLINILQLLILIMISPPGILIISGTNLDEFLSWVIMEYELFGSYLLPFICCLYWPNILIYAVIIFSPIK